MIINGTIGPVLRSESREFIPDVGWTHKLVFEGIGPNAEKSCYARGRQYAENGYRFSVDKIDGTPGWSLTCISSTPGDGSEEEPQESWRWRKELVQKSLWQHPEVKTAVAIWEADNGERVKKLFEDYLDAGDSVPDQTKFPASVPGVTQTLNWLYTELSRGADSFETDTIVLQLQRATTVNYAAKLVVGATALVYTSDKLFGTGGPAQDCPDDIKSLMPGINGNTEPDAVTSAQWGWRERGDEGGKEGWTRFIQSKEWVYAAWSTNIYTLA